MRAKPIAALAFAGMKFWPAFTWVPLFHCRGYSRNSDIYKQRRCCMPAAVGTARHSRARCSGIKVSPVSINERTAASMTAGQTAFPTSRMRSRRVALVEGESSP